MRVIIFAAIVLCLNTQGDESEAALSSILREVELLKNDKFKEITL